MIRSDEHWLALVDSFHSAAIDGNGWYAALEGLAETTGSCSGELIGLGSNAAVPFNLVTNMDPGFQEDFIARGGGDPTINARVRAGTSATATPLKILAEYDYMTEDEYRRDPFLREMSARWGIGYTCITPLERQNGMLVGLAVFRPVTAGHITPEQRDVFAKLAAHARAAVRTQLALEGQGAALLSGALEALSIAALVCDRTGRVRSMTPAAEALVTSGRGLQLSSNRLQATQAHEARALTEAIDAAAVGYTTPGPPKFKTVILRNDQPDACPVVLDVIALPFRRHEFGFSPRVLVVARGARESDSRKAVVAQAVYGLTAAETDIALQLAQGRKPDAIAGKRGVSVGTVRAQIKTILAKLGVNGQIELVARLHQI